MGKRKYLFVIVCILLVPFFGCSSSPDLEPTQDRHKLSLSGTFVTESPDEISFPVKVLFAIDCSLSMGDAAMGYEDGSDPYYLRLDAVRNFIDQYNSNASGSNILNSLHHGITFIRIHSCCRLIK